MKTEATESLELAFLGVPLVNRFRGSSGAGGPAESTPVSFATRKSLALLIFLVAEGAPQSRDRLAALLWPDSELEKARATLRSTLVFLRKAIDVPGAPSHLIADRSAVAFDFRSPFTLDLQAFRAAYALSTQSSIGTVGSDVRAGVVSRLQAAADLYRGDFAEGLVIPDVPELADWLEPEREAWRRRADAILARLTRLQLDTAEPLAALEYTTRWLALSPLSEEAWRRLIQIHLMQRDRAAARRAYELCVAVLREGLDVDPAPETLQLAERIAHLTPDTEPARLIRPVLPDGVLVGRAAEMETLVDAFRLASQGETRLAIVEGEAGIGKTRLVEAFERWAEAQGGDVLHGRAFEAGRQLPYAAPAEALRTRLERERAPDDLLPDVWLAELGRLLPELRERYPDLQGPVADEATARPRLFEAIARLLSALAEKAPLAVIVDDAQWLDIDSMDCLRYCVRRLADEETPVLLLLIVRAEALVEDAPVSGFLAQLRQTVPADTLRLEPLTLEDTSRWLASVAALTEDVMSSASHLFAETGGHPLFMTEMVRLRLERGIWRLRFEEGSGYTIELLEMHTSLAGVVPSSAHEAIVGRMTGMPAPARNLLTAGSVLGTDATFEELCSVADLDESEGLTALDTLLRGRFLVEGADNRLLFAHDMVREAVYAEAGAARRRILHRRALEILQASAAPPGTLAGHAVAAGLWERGFELSVAAGEDAMRRLAVRDAIRHYERATDLAHAHGGALHLPLYGYASLGRAHELAGDISGARRVYDEMLSLAEEAEDIHMQALALNRLAGLASDANPLALEALRLLGRALELAERDGDRLVLAETELRLAQTEYYANRLAQANEHGERALALARELDGSDLIARCASILAHIAITAGRLEVAIKRAEEGLELATSLGDGVMEGDCLRLLGHARLRLGEPRVSMALLRHANEIAERLGNTLGRAAGEMLLALALIDTGEAAEALGAARSSLSAARRYGSPPYVIFALVALGGAQRALGMPDEARATHAEALEIAEGIGFATLMGLAASELCADLVLLGMWEEAHTCELKALRNRDHTASIFRGTIPRHWEIQALVHAGDLATAEEDLSRFEQQFAGRRRYRVSVLRGRAILLLARGLREEAWKSLEEALALAVKLELLTEAEEIRGTLGIETSQHV